MVFGLFKKKPDKVEVAANVASSVIQVQLTLSGKKLSAVSLDNDHYGLGYIFGFHDGVCQSMQIPGNSAEGFAALTLSFARLCEGQDAGTRVLNRCLALQTNQQFMQGMFAGGREALAYCKTETPPLGLAAHLRS